MLAWALVVVAYLIGAFPTGHLVGRRAGVDLRRAGSGNPGGTNAYRVLGARAGALVLLVDLLKGFGPVWFFPQWEARPETWALAYGGAAIAGHIWPVYTGFRGGKGVATAAGTLLALAPVAALIASLVWLGTLLLTRLASLASLLAATLVPLLARGAAAPSHVVLYSLLLAAIVWWTHRQNVWRLVRGEEPRIATPGASGHRNPPESASARRRRGSGEGPGGGPEGGA